MNTAPRLAQDVLGTTIDVLDWDTALARISAWASTGESRCVCLCNVHSVVTATRNPGFRNTLGQADMATPDGAPIAWMLRRLGHPQQDRINGPDLMWRYCALAAARGEKTFLYGAEDATLDALERNLGTAFPGLHIAASHSPPFRPLTADEDRAIVERINASGAKTVWVALGCPKQEQWMAAHRGAIRAVMIGVGAAFDYHAGTLRRAPRWMQDAGLEWLYRLLREPGRLWRRYLLTNTLFILGALRQLVTMKRNSHE